MFYHVNPQTRMVRTTEVEDAVPPPPWVEVTSAEYDQFRKASKIFLTPSNQREARMAGNGNELTLKGLKRAATKAKKAAWAIGVEMTHTQALEQVSQLAGYGSYREARINLGEVDE